MVKVGDFCKVLNSRYVDYNIKKGDLVYVAGEMMSVIDEKDPYVYRKLFVAAFMEGFHVDSAHKPLSMDAMNLEPVSVTKQKRLYKLFEADFADKGGDSSDA